MGVQIAIMPERLQDPEARQFASLVADGRIDSALAAAAHLKDDVNTVGNKGVTALEIAVEHLDPAMVTALLNAGADPNGPPDDAPLHKAVRLEGLTIARQFLAAGARPDGERSGDTSLQEAALFGARPALALLLEHDA